MVAHDATTLAALEVRCVVSLVVRGAGPMMLRGYNRRAVTRGRASGTRSYWWYARTTSTSQSRSFEQEQARRAEAYRQSVRDPFASLDLSFAEREKHLAQMPAFVNPMRGRGPTSLSRSHLISISGSISRGNIGAWSRSRKWEKPAPHPVDWSP